MTVEELSQLARTYEEAILSNKLTKAEAVMLVALIETRISFKLSTQATRVEPKLDKIEILEKIPDPLKSTGIHYDPIFDPPPPIDPEVLPPRADTSHELLLTKNHACICSACNKVAYIVKADVRNGDKVDKFIDALVPQDGVPAFHRTTEMDNANNQLVIDCPMCKAQKSLYLKGRKNAAESGSI